MARRWREQIEQQGLGVNAARPNRRDEPLGLGFFTPQHELGQMLDVVGCRPGRPRRQVAISDARGRRIDSRSVPTMGEQQARDDLAFDGLK
jgi:hypothetical protein